MKLFRLVFGVFMVMAISGVFLYGEEEQQIVTSPGNGEVLTLTIVPQVTYQYVVSVPKSEPAPAVAPQPGSQTVVAQSGSTNQPAAPQQPEQKKAKHLDY